MKRGLVVVQVLCMGLAVAAYCAEQEQWQRLSDLMGAITRNPAGAERQAAVREYEQYLENLTVDQLVLAGRQMGRHVEQNLDRARWFEAGWALHWLYESYPRKSGNLHVLQPLLTELGDNGQPEFWRWALIQLLTVEWDLPEDVRMDVLQTLSRLGADLKAPDGLRQQALVGAPALLRTIKPVAPGEQDEERLAFQRQVEETASAFVRTASGVLGDEKAPADVRRAALTALAKCHRLDLPLKAQIEAVLADAVARYKSFPEAAWPDLAAVAAKTLQAPDAPKTVERMLAAASDEQVQRRLNGLAFALEKAAKAEEEEQPLTVVLRRALRAADSLPTAWPKDNAWETLCKAAEASRPAPPAEGEPVTN